MRNPVAKNAHKFNRSSVQEDKTKKSPEGDILDGLEEHYIEIDERPSANTPEQIAWAEYKARCDQVLLGRAGTEPGVVFDKQMTDDEVGVVLYDIQRMNLALQEPHITLPPGLSREEKRRFITSKVEGMAALKESYSKAEEDGTLVKRPAKPERGKPLDSASLSARLKERKKQNLT